MRNLLMPFVAIFIFASCNPDNTPDPQPKSTQSTSGIDTFVGLWITNYGSFNVNDIDSFHNSQLILERFGNDSAMLTRIVNSDSTRFSWWDSDIDTASVSGSFTYLYSYAPRDSGWQEVFLFGTNDSIYWNSRSIQDTNKFGRFYGTH